MHKLKYACKVFKGMKCKASVFKGHEHLPPDLQITECSMTTNKHKLGLRVMSRAEFVQGCWSRGSESQQALNQDTRQVTRLWHGLYSRAPHYKK